MRVDMQDRYSSFKRLCCWIWHHCLYILGSAQGKTDCPRANSIIQQQKVTDYEESRETESRRSAARSFKKGPKQEMQGRCKMAHMREAYRGKSHHISQQSGRGIVN